jgi:hypothetical protein
VAKYEDGEDLGVEIEIEIEKGSDLSGGQNDGTVHRDAKGCMPHEDEKHKPDDKRQNNGIDLPDSKPDFFLEDKDEEDENSSSELIIEGVPHCDDCVVMFASMAGK